VIKNRLIQVAQTTLVAPSLAGTTAQGETVATRLPQNRMGWLPLLTLVGALGLFMIAIAYNGARTGELWASSLFWYGLLVLIVPMITRLVLNETSRYERIGIVVLLGCGLYLVKFLHSPLAVTFHDEFVHWRTVSDILETGRLFTANPVILVSPQFPGLEIITSALMQLTGLGFFEAGIIVLLFGRLLFVLSLYLIYEHISRSEQIAAIAVVLCMANPNFVFFGAQFAYKSLAFPLAAFVLFLAIKREHLEDYQRRPILLLALIALTALVMTHHLIAYALIVLLFAWAVVMFAQQRLKPLARLGLNGVRWYGGEISTRRFRAALARYLPQLKKIAPNFDNALARATPGKIAVVGLTLCIFWATVIAPLTINYLQPVLSNAFTSLFRLITGESTGRRLFQTDTGEIAPVWERFVGFASVIIVTLIIPLGLWQIWKRRYVHPLVITLGVAVLFFPMTLILRLTRAGWETGNRSSELLYVAIGIIVAIGIYHLPQLRIRYLRTILATTAITIIFLGGVVSGWSFWQRMPGPFLVSADTRSITPQGVLAADWTRHYLFENNAIYSDRINNLLLLSYGHQYVTTNSNHGISLSWLFHKPEYTEEDLELLKYRQLRYLLVDRRLSEGAPMVGRYFESGEPRPRERNQPFPLHILEKFDRVPRTDRVFDSGAITIYDVGVLSGER
jgi:hypothetical protein